MKIVITGSLGHISKPLTEKLLAKGHIITVISSKHDKQKEIEKLGAKAAIGSVENSAFLTETFRGADAVYTMLPHPNFADPNLDPMTFARTISNNFSRAIQDSGVKRVVHLSSIGAHLDQGTGLILMHHQAENTLGGLPGVNITFMRPVGFYYNLFSFVGGIKASGIIASNYGADDRIPWAAPADIATSIAEEIESPLAGQKIRYVASEELTCNETARILGEAINKPDLKWKLITDEQLKTIYENFGMPKVIIKGIVEMQSCMHKGPFYDDYYLQKPILGKTKMKDFALEFAAIFNQG